MIIDYSFWYYLLILNLIITLLVLTYLSVVITLKFNSINNIVILNCEKITNYFFHNIINKIEIQFDLIEEKICFDGKNNHI